MSLRYYLYVSDTKVDMLLSQIDPAWSRKRATEVSLGLKMAGVRHSVESTGADRVARLERVLRHLDDHGALRGVDEPGRYVRGVLPMQWAAVDECDGVYFGGRSERTVVGLGGSTGHVLSTVTATPPQDRLSASLMPALLDLLGVLAAEGGTPEDAPLEHGTGDADALAMVVQANASLRGPVQALEFVAVRMLQGPCPYPEMYRQDDMAVLLGSPLYIALAD